MKNPRRLNLSEMWELYGLLRTGIDDQDQQYLVDEVSDIMSGISRNNFVDSIKLLFPDAPAPNPAEAVLQFVSGLRRNNFFEFATFIRGLNGNSKR